MSAIKVEAEVEVGAARDKQKRCPSFVLEPKSNHCCRAAQGAVAVLGAFEGICWSSESDQGEGALGSGTAGGDVSSSLQTWRLVVSW